MITVDIAADLVIVIGYFTCAVVLVPGHLGRHLNLPVWCKVPWICFFVLCGMTHLHEAEHAWSDTPMDFGAPHSWGHKALQAAAVWGAIGTSYWWWQRSLNKGET